MAAPLHLRSRSTAVALAPQEQGRRRRSSSHRGSRGGTAVVAEGLRRARSGSVACADTWFQCRQSIWAVGMRSWRAHREEGRSDFGVARQGKKIWPARPPASHASMPSIAAWGSKAWGQPRSTTGDQALAGLRPLERPCALNHAATWHPSASQASRRSTSSRRNVLCMRPLGPHGAVRGNEARRYGAQIQGNALHSAYGDLATTAAGSARRPRTRGIRARAVDAARGAPNHGSPPG